jgi:hypothetical protein
MPYYHSTSTILKKVQKYSLSFFHINLNSQNKKVGCGFFLELRFAGKKETQN